MPSYVYILASRKNGTLYTGVTSNLIKRVYEHKEKVFGGFTAEYNVNLLVYYEMHEEISEAILREKRIKKWRRAWKLELIEKENPYWKDLYEQL
ncbi:MAG: GIY-YIG nuclease family protein [Alphaproteobacteria bacterium]|nr:GIY-YIG nuclease family protein [Alphaproteobacteria bacterium]